MTSPEPARLTRADVAVIALLCALPLLAYADILIGGHHFGLGDHVRYSYPMKKSIAETIRSGAFPWWDRMVSAGQPMAANPAYEIFYPLQLPILLPEFDLGYRLHVLVHLPLALAGMYLFLRSFGMGASAAVLGALSFGFGGAYISTVNLLPFLFSMTWMPWVALFGSRFARSGSRRDLAAAGLAGGIQATIGEPVTIVQTWLVVAALAAWEAMSVGENRPRRIVRAMRNVLASGSVAIAVALVQLLPAIDHLGDSTRARGIPWEAASRWSTAPIRLAEWIHPALLGSNSGGPRDAYLVSIYPGLACTLLFGAAVFSRRRGARAAAALLGVAILVAFGSNTPLFRILHDTGIAGFVRYPEKFMLVVSFAIAGLAARAADDLFRGDAAVRRSSIIMASCIVTVLTVCVAGTALHSYPATFAQMRGLPPADPQTLALADEWQTQTSLAALRALALLAILLASRAIGRRGLIACVFLFVIIDLGFHAERLVPRVDGEFFRTPPPIAMEVSGGRVFVAADYEPVPAWLARPELAGTRTLWTLRNGLFPRTAQTWGVAGVLESDFDATTLSVTNELVEAMLRVRSTGNKTWYRPFVAMSAVTDVVLTNEGGGAPERFDAWRDRPTRAEPVRSSVPRYYFADAIVQIRNKDDFARALAWRTWSDHTAFVFSEVFRPAPGRVLSARENPSEAHLEVESTGDALLVASVSFHRDWQWRIDGVPVRAERVNLGYQGVVVPRGRHRVEMRMRNPLVAGGAVLSALSVIGCLVLLMGGRRRRGSVRGAGVRV